MYQLPTTLLSLPCAGGNYGSIEMMSSSELRSPPCRDFYSPAKKMLLFGAVVCQERMRVLPMLGAKSSLQCKPFLLLC